MSKESNHLGNLIQMSRPQDQPQGFWFSCLHGAQEHAFLPPPHSPLKPRGRTDHPLMTLSVHRGLQWLSLPFANPHPQLCIKPFKSEVGPEPGCPILQPPSLSPSQVAVSSLPRFPLLYSVWCVTPAIWEDCPVRKLMSVREMKEKFWWDKNWDFIEKKALWQKSLLWDFQSGLVLLQKRKMSHTEEISLQRAGICFSSSLWTRGGRICLRILPFWQNLGTKSQENSRGSRGAISFRCPWRFPFMWLLFLKGTVVDRGMLCSVLQGSDALGPAARQVP